MSTKCPKKNFARKNVCSFLVLLFTSIAVSAADLDIKKGSVDLLKSEVFSRPFTIFDQLLYSLEKKAIQDAEYLQLKNSDFMLSTFHYPSAAVTYEKEISRVGVSFPVNVSSMNDPWREVCARHANNMAVNLGVSSLGSQAGLNPDIKDALVRAFFSRFLGPKVSSENMPLASMQPFLDAIVVKLTFSVVRADNKGLAYLRACALDIKNGDVKYYEHKY